MILWISSLPLVRSPLFLILLTWILSFCVLVSFAKGLSILLIFSKNQLLVSLILCIVFFFSNWLISVLILIISCLLFIFGVLASFLFPLEISSVLLNCCYEMCWKKGKLGRAYISSLTTHLKALEKRKQICLRGVEGRK